jgi:osmoprotectant transport system ATP-binding protein
MITFKNVTKKFGNKLVISNINFEINDGEIVVLLGTSGCGKTTTLKMINRLEVPTEGTIFYNGKEIDKEDLIPYRRKIGYVLQNTGLFPHMTIRENLSLLPKLEKQKEEKINENNKQLLEMVDLEPDEYLDRYPYQLSGGQKQRIGVARGVALDPDVVLMDEPFSAVDPIIRSSLQEELLKIQAKAHKTIVFVTHDISEAIHIADKICILNHGEIAQYDTPENIVKSPATEFVNHFISQALKSFERTNQFMNKFKMA